MSHPLYSPFIVLLWQHTVTIKDRRAWGDAGPPSSNFGGGELFLKQWEKCSRGCLAASGSKALFSFNLVLMPRNYLTFAWGNRPPSLLFWERYVGIRCLPDWVSLSTLKWILMDFPLPKRIYLTHSRWPQVLSFVVCLSNGKPMF